MEISNRDSNFIKSSNGIIVECRSQQYVLPSLQKSLSATREESNSRRNVRLKIIMQPTDYSFLTPKSNSYVHMIRS